MKDASAQVKLLVEKSRGNIKSAEAQQLAEMDRKGGEAMGEDVSGQSYEQPAENQAQDMNMPSNIQNEDMLNEEESPF